MSRRPGEYTIDVFHGFGFGWSQQPRGQRKVGPTSFVVANVAHPPQLTNLSPAARKHGEAAVVAPRAWQVLPWSVCSLCRRPRD
jgi:hypothetical protein